MKQIKIIELPVNKSEAIRVLAMQYILNLEDSVCIANAANDIKVMQRAIKSTDFIDFEDAGTPLRIMLGLYAASNKKIRIVANDTLQKRPLKELLVALENAGAQFVYENESYKLPLSIISGIKAQVSELKIDNTKSSQFLSSLLFSMALLPSIKSVQFTNKNSWQYVLQTVQTLKNFGIEITENQYQMELKKHNLKPYNQPIENDWTSLFYFANLVIAGATEQLEFNNLNIQSLQADAKTLKIYEQLGLKAQWKDNNTMIISYKQISVLPSKIDIIQCIDSGPTLLCLIAYMQWPIAIEGYHNLKLKESDRVQSVKLNLIQFGLELLEENNQLKLRYNNEIESLKEIKCFKDHRIAMAFSLFKMRYPKLGFDTPEVVNKSFPNFWEQFNSVF